MSVLDLLIGSWPEAALLTTESAGVQSSESWENQMKSPANFAHRGLGLAWIGALALVTAACSGGSPSAAASSAESAPDAVPSTPAYVLLTVPASAEVPDNLAQELVQWKKSGLVSDVTRLDRPNAKAEEGELSTLAILDFANEDSYEEWQRQSGSAFGGQVMARRADLVQSGGTHTEARPGSYYLVHIHGIPATPEGPDAYKGFLAGYMKPLLEGQREAGVLTGYRLFIERDPSGGVGRSIWAAQYRDAAAYEETSAIKRKIRENLLANDPGFAKYRNEGAYKGLREALAFYPADYVEVQGN